MNRIRIATFADRFAAVGGIERVQLDLCRHLAARGHDLSVLVKEVGELESAWAAFARVEVVGGFTVRRDRPVAGLRRVAHTARRAAATHPDVLYIHRHAMAQSAWPAHLLARGAGIVCHLHAMAPAHRGVVTRFLLDRVDRFVAVSDAVAASWADAGIEPDRLITVPNGVDTERFRPATPAERDAARRELGIADDAFVVCFTGRLDPDKGVHVLVDAVAELARTEPSLQLLVLGGDPSTPAPDEDRAYLARLAAAAPPGTCWVPRRLDVRPALWAADVAALPSLTPEPHPLAVLEALACGVPVVASASGGIAEQLTGTLATGLVAPGDVEALRAGIASLVSWRRDRPGLADHCRAEARERFSQDRVADAIEDVLVSAARPPRARARRTAC